MKVNTLLCIIGVPRGGSTVVAEILESWGYDGGDYGDGLQHECLNARRIIEPYWWWMDRKPKDTKITATSRLHKYIEVRNRTKKQFFKCPYASLLMCDMNFSRTHIQFIHVKRNLESAVASAMACWQGKMDIKRWREAYKRIESNNEALLKRNHNEVITEISYEALVNSPKQEVVKLGHPLGISNDDVNKSCSVVKQELRHF